MCVHLSAGNPRFSAAHAAPPAAAALGAAPRPQLADYFGDRGVQAALLQEEGQLGSQQQVSHSHACIMRGMGA